ncbi:MAG: OmpA family protein [Gammaproteobacteria bacterium]|nr:OmpA family protein [Gammaproteobacteria bacterium]MYG95185.1 OmpA family protein [Gammaproteobacteria bacterium]
MNDRIIPRNLFCAVLAVAGIAIAGSAPAQEPVYYISPGLNLLEFDQENMLENNEVGFTFSLGVDFDRHWSAELGFMEADPTYAGDQKKADLDTWEVGLRYTLGQPGDRLRPYVSGAVGNINIDGENDTLLNYGAGLEFELRDQVVLRAGMSRYNYLGRDSDIGFNAGLVYYLGERNPPPPPAPSPPPEPVAVAPPPDSDGDGVPDPDDDCPNTPSNYAVHENGCPILIEEIARFELQVNFDFDESVIRDEDVPEIEDLAEFLREYDGVMLQLEGHTDNVGTQLYNLDLSQRRADAVRDMLIEDFGISPGRVTAQGFGEQIPVADNETEAGREANRRVVAVVSETLQRYQER